MELLDFENNIKLMHSDWTLTKSQSGTATWLNIAMPNNVVFTIQITPSDGVGISRRSGDEFDFGGHEELFGDLSDVLKFLESHE